MEGTLSVILLLELAHFSEWPGRTHFKLWLLLLLSLYCEVNIGAI